MLHTERVIERVLSPMARVVRPTELVVRLPIEVVLALPTEVVLVSMRVVVSAVLVLRAVLS
jgi:hypothetical protein